MGATSVTDCVCNTGFFGAIISETSPCSPITCDGDQINLETGQFNPLAQLKDLAFDTPTVISCAEGYHTSGVSPTFKCNGLGQDGWGNADTSGLTCTRIKCKLTDLGLNDHHRVNSKTVGDQENVVDYDTTVTVTCANGYWHSGTPSLAVKCTGEGQHDWNEANLDNWKANLQCTPITCDASNLPLNNGQQRTQYANDLANFGETLQYSCREGFYVSGAVPEMTCTGSGGGQTQTSGFGTFDVNDLTCTAITCSPGDLTLKTGVATTPATTVAYDQTVRVSCAEGFYENGHVDVTCKGNVIGPAHGFVNADPAEAFTCQPIKCHGSDVVLQDGQITSIGKSTVGYNAKVAVFCKTGYKSTGSVEEGVCTGAGNDGFGDVDTTTLTCTDTDPCSENQLWTGALPNGGDDVMLNGACSDAPENSGFNDPTMYCATACSMMNRECTHFFVYGKDSQFPGRCCFYTAQVAAGAATVSGGSFYEQTCNWPDVPGGEGGIVPEPGTHFVVAPSITTIVSPVPVVTHIAKDITVQDHDGNNIVTGTMEASIVASPKAVPSLTEEITRPFSLATPSVTKEVVIERTTATVSVYVEVPHVVTVNNAASLTVTASPSPTVTALASAKVTEVILPYVGNAPMAPDVKSTRTQTITMSPSTAASTTKVPSATVMTTQQEVPSESTDPNGQHVIVMVSETVTLYSTLVPSPTTSPIHVPSYTTSPTTGSYLDEDVSPGAAFLLPSVYPKPSIVASDIALGVEKTVGGAPTIAASPYALPSMSSKPIQSNIPMAAVFYAQTISVISRSPTVTATTSLQTTTVPENQAPTIFSSTAKVCADQPYYDRILGLTLADCKKRCAEEGVYDCKETSGDNCDKSNSRTCNAIAHSQSQICITFSECVLSTDDYDVDYKYFTYGKPAAVNGQSTFETEVPVAEPSTFPVISQSVDVFLTLAKILPSTGTDPSYTHSPTHIPTPTHTQASVEVWKPTITASLRPQAALPDSIDSSRLRVNLYGDEGVEYVESNGGQMAQSWLSSDWNSCKFQQMHGRPKKILVNDRFQGTQAINFDEDAVMQRLAVNEPHITLTSSRTIEAWVYTTGNSGTFLSYGQRGSATCQPVDLHFGASPAVTYGSTTVSYSSTLSNNQLHHVVMTYNGTEGTNGGVIRLYVDGSLHSTQDGISLRTCRGFNNQDRMTLGGINSATDAFSDLFKSVIATVRVWGNYVMGGNDVARMSNSPSQHIYPPDAQRLLTVDDFFTGDVSSQWADRFAAHGETFVARFGVSKNTNNDEDDSYLMVFGGKRDNTCDAAGQGGFYLRTSTEGCSSGFKFVAGLSCVSTPSSKVATGCHFQFDKMYDVAVKSNGAFTSIFVDNFQEIERMQILVPYFTEANGGYRLTIGNKNHDGAIRFQGILRYAEIFIEKGPATTPVPSVGLVPTITETRTFSPTQSPLPSVVSSATIKFVAPPPTPKPADQGTGGDGGDGGTGTGGGGTGTGGGGTGGGTGTGGGDDAAGGGGDDTTGGGGGGGTGTGGGGDGRPQQPPTIDPGCSHSPIYVKKFPNKAVGAVSGCTNDFASSGFASEVDFCAYRCSIDKSCNTFFVFSKSHTPSGRCCMQSSLDDSMGFYLTDGYTYRQTCTNPKPEATKTMIERHILKPVRTLTKLVQDSDNNGQMTMATFTSSHQADLNNFFQLVPALNEKAGFISIENVGHPMKYIRRTGQAIPGGFLEVALESSTADNSEYADQATFQLQPALSGDAGAFSFRSLSFPSYYLYADTNLNTLVLAPFTPTSNLDTRKGASFRLDPTLSSTEFDFTDLGEFAYCETYQKYAKVTGVADLQTCKSLAEEGVGTCGDNCGGLPYSGGAAQANMISYSSEAKQCMLWEECLVGTTTVITGFHFYEVQIELPEPGMTTCTVCDSEKEVVTRECTKEHDRVCECAKGYLGDPPNCVHAGCVANAHRISDGSKCECNDGFSGGPFPWDDVAQAYASDGSCTSVLCPAHASKTDDGSKCACDRPYVGGPFPFNRVDENYGTEQCELGDCPQFATQPDCVCITGYKPKIGDESIDGPRWVGGANGWGHTCAKVQCPAFSKEVQTGANGEFSCTCTSGSQGSVDWNAAMKIWLPQCQEVTCPENSVKQADGECRCADGYAGGFVWSGEKGSYQGACTQVSCPQTAERKASGACDCKQGDNGGCNWNLETESWECTCQSADCSVLHSYKPDANSLCKCAKGFSGTLTWDDDNDRYLGSCTQVNCPTEAKGHPDCFCPDGFTGDITWANQAYSPAACTRIACPDFTDQDTHPNCQCSSGYRLKDNTAIAWTGNSFSGSCEIVQCPDGASGEPNCKCKTGFRPNNFHFNGGSWQGSCDQIDCPNGGTHPNCNCPPGFTGSAAWTTQNDWSMAQCTAAQCPSNAVGGDGECRCKDGYAGVCNWVNNAWSCSCSLVVCPGLADRATSSSLCKCTTDHGEVSWNSEKAKYEGFCSTAPIDDAGTEVNCILAGTAQGFSEMLSQTDTFDMAGPGEFIMASGPASKFGNPDLALQVTLSDWKQTYANGQCIVNDRSWSVVKDVGLKCKDFRVVFEAPKPIQNDANTGCNRKTVNPGFFIEGKVTGSWEYKGEDRFENLAAGTVLAFDGGEIEILQNPCTNKDCTNFGISATAPRTIFEFMLKCGEVDSDKDSEVRVVSQCVQNGGCYTDVLLSMPPSGSSAEVKKDVLGAGVCGGWDPNVAPSLKTKHKRCREIAPTGFFTDTDDCRDAFTTTSASSIFRRFELLTKKMSRTYDAIHWDTDGDKGVDTGFPEPVVDEEQYNAAKAQCVATRKQIDSRNQESLDANKPIDSMFIALVEHCAQDTYRGLGANWDLDGMATHACDAILPKAEYERRDIACAATALSVVNTMTPAFIGTVRKGCQTCNPPRTAEATLRSEMGESENYAEEIEDSLQTLKGMSYAACNAHIPATDLTNLDCSNHVFRNTETWQCGAAVLPQHAEFAEPCTNDSLNAVCVTQCKAGYYRASGDGVATCVKVQGNGLNDVDVEAAWSSATLNCQPCTICANGQTETKACSPTSNRQCA
jgi:hypothetical protein